MSANNSFASLRLQLPLYPATTVYLQMMSESRSRINACNAGVGTGVSRRFFEKSPDVATQLAAACIPVMHI